MDVHARTLLTIITEADLERRLTEDILRLGARGYTISDVRGRGSRGARDATLDQTRNIRVEVICTREVAERIAAHLRKAYYDNYAMVAYLADVAVLRSGKF